MGYFTKNKILNNKRMPLFAASSYRMLRGGTSSGSLVEVGCGLEPLLLQAVIGGDHCDGRADGAADADTDEHTSIAHAHQAVALLAVMMVMMADIVDSSGGGDGLIFIGHDFGVSVDVFHCKYLQNILVFNNMKELLFPSFTIIIHN